MADARYITTEISKTMTSNRRNPRSAVIPPFSFVGALEIGLSGFWYPTSTMQLTAISLSASGPGASTATLSLLMEEPATDRPVDLTSATGGMTLTSTDTKIIRNLDRPTVTPYDKLYVVSWAASGHTGVVVQLVGELMN